MKQNKNSFSLSVAALIILVSFEKLQAVTPQVIIAPPAKIAEAFVVRYSSGFEKIYKNFKIVNSVPEGVPADSFSTLVFQTTGQENPVLGFGASLTESCSANLNQLNPEVLAQFMSKVASKKGARLNLFRIPVGASDYSVNNYSYEESRGRFSIERDLGTLTLLEKLKTFNPDLKVILSPWSPPSWMKNTGKLNGGNLKREFYQHYTEYLLKVVREYKKRNIPIFGMSIQNEPYYEDTRYPTCGFGTEEQIDFIADYLGPALRAEAPEVKILGIDHNFNLADEALKILNSRAKPYLGGVAFHCYSGEAENTKEVLKTGIPVIQTECTGVDGNAPTGDFFWWMNNMFINTLRAGYSASMGWNLCLGVKNEPRNEDGHDLCENCRGLLTIDRKNQKFHLNPEFEAMTLISHWVIPGSRVVHTQWRGQVAANSVVFETPESDYVVVLANDKPEAQKISVQIDRKSFVNLTVGASSTVVLRMKK